MREPESEGDRKLIHDVQHHGWHVIGIMEEGEEPAFAFSIGLFHNYQHPEVLIFGLSTGLMHEIINSIGAEIKAGKQFLPWSSAEKQQREYADILEGYRCAFRTVNESFYKEHLGYAMWFYEGQPFPALQCVWPDREQHFPWDAGFPPALAKRQPVLVS